MKKNVLVARIIAVFFFLVSAACYKVFAYPDPVGIITNYDVVAEDIDIQRANGEADGSDALLYPGDTIVGNLDQIKFKFGHYANVNEDGNRCQITYNPPSGIRQVAEAITDHLFGFWENVEDIREGANRGYCKTIYVFPQPGFNVTLLSSQRVHFGWKGTNHEKLIIQDMNGTPVFIRDIRLLNGIEVVPQEIGLKTGRVYRWVLDDGFQVHTFTLLSTQEEQQVLEVLAKIRLGTESEETKKIRQAAYLQLLSETYPNTIDLYWLSYQTISGLEATSDESAKKLDVLLLKCRQHLDKEI